MNGNGLKLIACFLASASLAACQPGGDAAGEGGTAPQGSASASGGGTARAQPGSKTIGDTLSQSQEHSTLLSAVKAAGLAETFSGAGPYTLFAPTNAAFQKLPAGAAEGLMQPQAKPELTRVLTYHVVPGVVTAKDLGAAIERGGGKAQLATVGGATLTASQSDGGIVISDGKNGVARVTQADLAQSNGVVHVIDGVLMPQ